MKNLTLVSNETFALTMVPPNHEIVGGKWLYMVKSGLMTRRQIRLASNVAKG